MPPCHYLRLAGKLLHVWEQHQLYRPLLQPAYLDEITDVFEELRKAESRWQTAWDFDLHLIRPGLDEERQNHFQSLKRLLRGLEPFPDRPEFVPTLRDFLGELQQLQEEFGELTIKWKRHRLSVTTESIQFQRIELGPFSIRLRWDDWAKIPSVTCFEIIALDPNPAGVDEDITHPHVKAQELCAGEATNPIRQALVAGRLAEAFILVRSVLTTYNPRSAYVPLDHWEGTFCPDCGDSVDESETYRCSGCEADFCDSCSTYCGVCDETRCFGCSIPCAECEARCCPGCLLAVGGTDQECCTQCAATCQACGEVVYTIDFDIQANRCKACLAESTTSTSQPLSRRPNMRRMWQRRQRRSLTFSPLAFMKLQYFCHAGDTEIGGFGISAKNNLLYVEDFVTVKQQTTAASVVFDDTAVADYFDQW